MFEKDAFHIAHEMVDSGPSYLGALLVQTKRHAEGLADLTAAEGRELGWLLQRTSRALIRCTPAAWTYAFSLTEGFRHVHLFVVARYPNTPKQYVRLAIMDWPGAPKGRREEVMELSRRLREPMASAQRGTPVVRDRRLGPVAGPQGEVHALTSDCNPRGPRHGDRNMVSARHRRSYAPKVRG